MTSRERVIRALNHQDTDRVPVDFGGTVVTSLDYHAHRKLKQYFGLPDGIEKTIDFTMGTVEPCHELMVMFGSDFRRVALNVIKPVILANTYQNGFGMTLRKADPHEYYDVVKHPLADAEVDDLDSMMLPDANAAELYTGLQIRARGLYQGTDYAIVGDFGVPGFYETAQKLRGYENLACDLLINKRFVIALFDRLLDLQKTYFANYLACVGQYVQIIGYADDLGMQDRLQMSPELYREMIKPYHQAIFRYIHEHTDAKILLHSCGAIVPVIEDLIEIGVDILNPVQIRAKDMDPTQLKKNYGSRIAFWGGVDEQTLLPFGSPEAVIAEVERLMSILGHEGGYVLAPGHNIQADTPVENIIAMYEAGRRINNTHQKIGRG